MNKFMRRLRSLISISAITSVLALTMTPASAADVVYAVPAAPKITSVVATNGGLNVTFEPTTSTPATTNFVLSGGTSVCPVSVAADQRTVFVPVLTTSPVAVSVQAVNGYGFSAVATSAAVAPLSVADSKYKLTQVLQLSDFHGAIEGTSSNMGVAKLATAWKADKAQVGATIAVSSGDNFGAAPPISAMNGEKPTVEGLNLAGLDVSTFGNHEHDRPLSHLREMIKLSEFQWVASNYSNLTPLRVSAEKRAKYYTIIERDGVKIGVVGINTNETKNIVSPGNLRYNYRYRGNTYDLVITGQLGKVQQAVTLAKRDGANIVIALVHKGYSGATDGKAYGEALDVAKQLKGVSAVYAAHTHLQYSSVISDKLVAQVANAGAGYNKSFFCVDTQSNKTLGFTNSVVTAATVSRLSADATAAAMVASYKAEITPKLDVKIGTVADKSPRGGTPPVERSGESALGSYAADLILNKYKTDIVIFNGGNIRDTFPATTYVPSDKTLRRPATTSDVIGPWDVTFGDAFAVFPFGNAVATTTMTGAQIWDAMENGVSAYPANGRFPQIAGFKLSIDVTKPVGSRVVSITLNNGKAIADNSSAYTVATTDFLVFGGDGYTMMNPSKAQLRTELQLDVFVEALKADMAAGKVTTIKTDGRITVKK